MTMSEKYWVLRDGKKYFQEWTGIGPRATTDIAEAKRFATRREAEASPASAFPLTFYEPVRVGR
jgi:hypothetical protein